MKNIHKIFLLLIILLIMSTPAVAASNNMDNNTEQVKGIPILLDGQALYTNPMSFIDPKDSYTLVPVRFITESLNAKVEWEEKTKKVTVVQGKNTIIMNIDSRVVYINGTKKTLEKGITPKLVRNSTMVPLRFLSETFGYKVDYDDKLRMPIIETFKIEESKVHNIVEKSGYIHIDKSGEIEFKKTKLENPKRIVLDLLDTSVDKNYAEYNSNINELKKIRVSQFESDIYGKDRKVVRLVLDLDEDYIDSNVEIKSEKDKMSLFLKSGGKVEVKPPVIAKPSEDKKPLENTNPSEDKNSSEEEKPSEDKQIIIPRPPNPGKKVIVIDPGHGGNKPGCFQNGIYEKDLVLEISKKLDKALVSNNYTSIMTRDDDFDVDFKDRSGIANKNVADLFVSIHANSANPAASGVEVWYNSKDKKYSSGDDSKYLAKTLSEEISKATEANNRGPKVGNGLIVLKPTESASVLIEVGFLSNAEEAEKLQQEEYQNKVVGAIIRGIDKYFREIY
ncbi:N-acetylmuramoyl-L-alanine amidase [Desulfonispora thiosulfatigenes DSM 11270]|uniref:N-acetylmuramoyl-L-alanine amidase n=1 Tax=Desulfonispora thiosulfatigenes DSM 11270 TaxID=656914 RepID=A0A1W1UWP1_DESTI|nr:N-acetylmuramoyl-L-alanine amidase family protein [Desulfonispora thiosulfatigenes]SMB85114.1 N-acetylmuramoyl-L-alanine amidase [Desulfonispora thiosulfatigenes DSM 11270]